MSVENQIETFRFTPEELQIDWQDGQTSRLHCVWLRDHCQMPSSRNAQNGQRLMNVTDFPDDLRIEGVTQQANGDLVVAFAPEGHESVFSQAWLLNNCYCLNATFDDRSEAAKTLWDAESFSSLSFTDYQHYCQDERAKRDCLQQVRDHGFALLSGVPCDEGQILEVIRTFGFCRETNYGPLFDVRTVVDPNNLAFSNLGLGCHADNPYRDPVPTVQLLHCLASSTEGGDSILVDGFKAASILRQEAPEHFEQLCRQYLNYRFSDATTELRSRVPMIEVDDRGYVTKVRYNNRSIDTVRLAPESVAAFYQAYRHYAGILERPELKLTFKLRPGDLVVFDNTRVMHARTAFSAGGQRHLQGAYADLDGLYSTLAVLERARNTNELVQGALA
ncbi:2-trimethylaminoethylphosphonate dioxygenase [Marinobacter zhejiangensis]|nr:gamma-butyrobetaine dioxygenase [Marinobacter zhejiangensis]